MAVHTGAFEPRTRQPGQDDVQPDARVTGNRPVRRRSLQIIAVLLCFGALWSAQELLIPLVFAGLASCGLEPVHRRLVRMHVPRSASAALILVMLVGIFAWGTWALSRQATTFV